jgi:type II secretory pathway pseudopilin PulG
MIELILVIMIVAILSLVLSSFIMSATNSWIFVKSRQSALSEARSTIERMVREIRRINKPSSIVIADNSEIDFIDINSDNIDFYQNGSILLRNGEIIAEGVSNPGGLSLNYYDSSLNPTAIHQNIHYISICLTLVRGNETVTVKDGVRIRNL